MTKEEIVKKNYELVFTSPKYDNSVNKGMNQEYIFPAMGEWAKRFGQFIADEVYRPNLIGSWRKNYGDSNITTEELYLIFLKSTGRP